MSYRPNKVKQVFHFLRRSAASGWISSMPALQIAITGSQGKTNTSSALFHVLSHLASTIRTDLNLDTVYNVPITALKISPSTRFAIFELGIDRKGEMDLHLGIVRPKIAIITGISPVHTDKEHLGTFENLILEKRKLIEALPSDGFAILNGDDPHVREMASRTKAKTVFYGKSVGSDIRATGIDLSLRGIDFDITDSLFDGSPSRLHVSIPVVAEHQAYTAMAVYAVYRALGFKDTDTFTSLISGIPSLPGRMSLEKGPMGTTLINDSLRANPASMRSGLKTLSLVKTTSRKIAVLAEMGELEKPEEEHARIGEFLNGLNLDYVVTIGPLHAHTARSARSAGFPAQKIHETTDVVEASRALAGYLKKGDLVYIKGSLLRHVERVLMLLDGREVVCRALLCPFYHHCPECRYLKTGYPPAKDS